MAAERKIIPCLWFDTEAEEAARFYISVVRNARIGGISRYGKEGFEIDGCPEGSVMTVEFEIEGQSFVAFNGGPQFRFSEAVSFQAHCETQDDIDYFWDRLSEGGERPCGCLKDRFGLSWQIIPTALPEMLSGQDPERTQRVTKAFLRMKKFDIAALTRAYEGQ